MGRTTFSSAKQRRLRIQKRREVGSSDGIDKQPSWRLGCKICCIHLESILEAASSASRVELTLTAMAVGEQAVLVHSTE